MKKQIEKHLSLISTAMEKLLQSNTKENAETYGTAIQALNTYLRENPLFPDMEGLAMYAKDIVRFRNEALSQYRAFGHLSGKPFSEWLVKDYVKAKNWIHFAD
jgi:hypothetical protein